eukprot:2513911-Rhodomonas_salina.3
MQADVGCGWRLLAAKAVTRGWERRFIGIEEMLLAAKDLNMEHHEVQNPTFFPMLLLPHLRY